MGKMLYNRDGRTYYVASGGKMLCNSDGRIYHVASDGKDVL